MAERDDTEKLLKAVERILEENELEAFAECWNLGKELIEGLPVRAFYVCNDGSYANLAVLTDGLIIDIETEEDDDNLGDLTVISIKSIAEVHFREGPVHTIPDSEEAQLTLVLSMVGATDAGPYWIAESLFHKSSGGDFRRHTWSLARATLRIMNRHPASFTQAKELATVLSTSLARRRQRPIHAKVRSTTQRRDKTVNPLAPLGLGTISIKGFR